MDVVVTSYAALADDVRALLAQGRDVCAQVGPPGRVDVRLVGELARLDLLARRSGARLRVHDATGRLPELLGLVGLGREEPTR